MTEKLTPHDRSDYLRHSSLLYNKDLADYNDGWLNSAHVPTHKLNCYFNMRSSDIFLGLPFNISFYALFTHLLANQFNMIPGTLIYSAADVHLYTNHVEAATKQLTRIPKKLPTLKLTKNKNIFSITEQDIKIENYNPMSAIPAKVAI